ncbi:OLC1v1019523C1 [Oldenlandia corymbosa var. corymbosa]|uniref:OLC1v1019523C1 n=1 Tax=Oldenlandia corymbosa var. corymbosa TaxID=529605 RepID=A0AAV1EEP5_OLDCO|nr:OLC1v1019523C1 [Oldenlandia corymbosa var. corymbosa]
MCLGRDEIDRGDIQKGSAETFFHKVFLLNVDCVNYFHVKSIARVIKDYLAFLMKILCGRILCSFMSCLMKSSKVLDLRFSNIFFYKDKQ